MPYIQGDSPVETMRITPPYSVDLNNYEKAFATLLPPSGEARAVVLETEIENDEVVVHFRQFMSGGRVDLEEVGIYTLAIALLDHDAGSSRQLPLVRFVVEQHELVQDWHTISSAREADWPDAREMSDMTLYELLETAKHDVIEFAPVLAEGQPIPPSYRMAQLAHARNRWNAALADPGTGDIGGEGFAIPARPLDWQIKQLLRPSRGIPAGF